MNYSLDDTIVALSTPYGKSAIAVIRISGKNALNIAYDISESVKSKNNINNFKSHKTYHVDIKDDNTIIDNILMLIMKSPNTYTTEDTVELYIHGSIPIIERVINLIIKKGARLASKGEFTYRAYINGKIDISEAMAIHDLISSNNYLEAEASVYKMKGRLKTEVDAIKEALTDTLIRIEGELDFPEDETIEFSYDDIYKSFINLKDKINYIINASNVVKKFINGIHIAIIGKTNVGKSSIFNMLLGMDRSIVSNIAGTTRDSLHECIYIDGIPYYLMDTAGFHNETENEIEQMGIERAIKCSNEADIIIAVFDYNKKFSADDIAIIEFLKIIKNKKIIFVLNKSDLEKTIDYYFENKKTILLSAKNKLGKDELIQSIKSIIEKDDIELLKKETYINIQEQRYLEQSIEALDNCLVKISDKENLDIIAEEARTITRLINNISHPTTADDIIDEIFSKFCIGK